MASTSSMLENPKDVFRRCNDLTKLGEITLENVLDCLIERYSAGKYYTFAGSMLISLNPCLHKSRKSINDFNGYRKFEDDATYVNSPNGGRGDDKTPGPELNKDPHIICVGQDCLKSLLTVGNNQVIIVSGDSGAGKTTAIQQLLRYFVTHSESLTQMQTPNRLDKRIYIATLILESMGNASTRSNPNSSRFGRFVQLNYGAADGSIIGASIRTCLLEKHRVSKCSRKERNFHIFYYVLFGLEKGLFHLSDFVDSSYDNELEPIDWRQLIPRYFIDAMQPTDSDDFLFIYHELQTLNMLTELKPIFRIVFGLMVLLNTQFVQYHNDDNDVNGEDLNDNGYDTPFSENGSTRGKTKKEFSVANEKMLKIVAVILGLKPNDLIEALIARKIVAGRKSIYRKLCESVKECDERLAAFASTIYDAAFNYVLGKVNSMLCTSSPINALASGEPNGISYLENLNKTKMLSLLDLYGFENLETNHLEQLCINYANERLHQIYLQNLKICDDELSDNLSTQQVPLELNRIQKESWDRINSLNNILFRHLNEECVLNRSPLDSEVYERLASVSKDSKYLVYEKPMQKSCLFIVKHYASDVQYECNGLLSKNLDYVPPEFSQLFQNSTADCIKLLLPYLSQDETSVTQTGRTNKNEKTVLQRFKVSVHALVNELSARDNQDIHFIKCIRPSYDLRIGKIQPSIVQKQLFSCGIVDAIRISGNGFPIRVLRTKFLKVFHTVFKRCCCGTPSLDNICGLFGLEESKIRFGNTQIFMTETIWMFFRQLNVFILNHSAKILQARFKENRRKKQHLAALAPKNMGETSHLLSPFGSYGDGDVQRAQRIQTWSSNTIAHTSRTTRKLQSFADAIRELAPLIEELNLGVEDGIVTRGQIYHGPVRFFTRKPVLPFAHIIPHHMKRRGLEFLNA